MVDGSHGEMLTNWSLHRIFPFPFTFHRNSGNSFLQTTLSKSQILLIYCIMKKLFSLLSILGIIAISNCSQIPENNDPILGIWSRSQSTDLSGKTAETLREEWIFNDVYLGRYQSYSNSKLVFYTDFKWSVDRGNYSITYGDPQMDGITVNLEQANEPEML